MDDLRTSLPGWEIVRCIGSGSSGKVYEIRKKDEYGGDFHCALKVISVPGTQKEYDEMAASMDEFTMRAKLRAQVEEISNEYRLLGALRGHPNVVNCEDQMIIPHTEDMGWDIYIRMELLTSLPEYVSRNGMTVEDVVRLGSDMCSALELCREKGIIHRDIKPQNIFVSAYGVYKLGDFGVAKSSVPRISGDKVGTYSYMAPEVYKGTVYDDRVDIYSLGMVLYWLLNDRRGPFLPLPPQTPTADQTADAQIRRFRGESLPPPGKGGAALKKVVQKAVSYKIADRYQSPTELKSALNAALSGKAPEPPTAPASEDATIREEFIPDRRPRYIPEAEPAPAPQPRPRPQQPAPQPKKQPAPAEKARSEDKKMPGYVVALILLVLAMAAAIVIFIAAGKSGGGDPEPSESIAPTVTATKQPEKLDVKSLMLSSPSLKLTVEDEAKLKVTCTPEPKDGQEEPGYIWKSSDTDIVTVDQSGKLKAISPGAATVMVYVKDKMEVYDQCTVIVEEPKVTELTIEEMPTKTVYTMGEQLDTTGLVLRAYYNNGSAKRITDPSEYDAECDMTGLGNREATISYGGMTVTYTVRISLFG